MVEYHALCRIILVYGGPRPRPSRDTEGDVTGDGACSADGPTELLNICQITRDGDREPRVETSKPKDVADGTEITDEQ